MYKSPLNINTHEYMRVLAEWLKQYIFYVLIVLITTAFTVDTKKTYLSAILKTFILEFFTVSAD